MIVMMMILAFSLNLFGDNCKTWKHICIDECKTECKMVESKKECGSDFTKSCYAEKKVEVKHLCTDKCKKDCKEAEDYKCLEECKNKDVEDAKKCKPDCTKPCCAEQKVTKCDHPACHPCTDKCK